MSNKYYNRCNMSSSCPSNNFCNKDSIEKMISCSKCPSCGCCGLNPPEYIPQAYFPIYNSNFDTNFRYKEMSESPSGEPTIEGLDGISVKKDYEDYQKNHLIELEQDIRDMKLTKRYKSELEKELGPNKSLKEEEDDLLYNQLKASMGLQGIRISNSNSYISSAPTINMNMYNVFYTDTHKNCPGTFNI